MPECENATLASRVFQLISEGRLKAARTEIEAELIRREPIPQDLIDHVVALYNNTGLPKVTKLTDSRKRALCARLKEQDNATWWELYFRRVAKSDFLMGRKPGVNWRANFDWLVKPANMVKVLEGQYDSRANGNGAAKFDAQDQAAFRMSGSFPGTT